MSFLSTKYILIGGEKYIALSGLQEPPSRTKLWYLMGGGVDASIWIYFGEKYVMHAKDKEFNGFLCGIYETKGQGQTHDFLMGGWIYTNTCLINH